MTPPVEVPEESVRELLRGLCIPVNLKGYEYLVRALRISSNNPSRSLVCRDIYELVKAELSLGVSIKSIETSIREAIAKALPIIPDEKFKKVFGASKIAICRGKTTISNTTFIRGVTEYLLIHERRLKYEEIDESPAVSTVGKTC